jgi:hypothetical protein
MLVDARKKDGLDIKRVYAPVVMSRHQNVGENHDT